jgi:hypothetical protein
LIPAPKHYTRITLDLVHKWRHNIKLLQWPTMNKMQSGALLVENAGAHVVQ